MRTLIAIVISTLVMASPSLGEKKPKPGAAYTWRLQTGSITLSLKWCAFDGVLRGVIQNSTRLSLENAVVSYRQYLQPLSGLIIDSPIAIVSSIPPLQSAEYRPVGVQLYQGCAIVLDSLDVLLRDVAGNQERQRLTAPDAEPFWYGGCQGEERKYRKQHPTR
jgi:hypothetical protein